MINWVWYKSQYGGINWSGYTRFFDASWVDLIDEAYVPICPLLFAVAKALK